MFYALTILHQDKKLPNVLGIYGGKLTSHHHTMVRVLKKAGLYSTDKPSQAGFS